MSRPRPSLIACAIAGALLGLLLFGVEGARVLRENPIGLNIDVKGPFAALLRVVRPLLPPLLVRVAAVYALAGALGGLYAALLTRLWGLRSRLAAWGLWLVEVALLFALLCLDRAILRPALFDDLSWFQGTLRWLVDHGEAGVVRATAAAVLLVQLLAAFFARRLHRGAVAQKIRFAASALVLLLAGTQLWANRFPSSPSPELAQRPEQPSAAQVSRTAPPRLVLLVGIDAFRVDRLRELGGAGDVAPNLEAFLRDATLFTNAWTPIAQTEPAWRSLVTARWPHRTGDRYPLTSEPRRLPAPTFPAELAGRGWQTSFTTDCSRFNFLTESSGFADRHQPPRGAINFTLEKLRFRLLGVFADNALGARVLPEFVENRALAGLYEPVGFAQRLARRIADAAGRGPALFAYHSVSAHFPGDPSYPFYREKVPATAPLSRRLRMFFSPITGAAHGVNGWGRPESEALYDELISQADAQLGILIDTLKRRGLYDDAAIIVFSDHGESFHADHPELWGATPVHGARLSKEENRILLAVKLPRGTAPRIPRSEAFVRLVDLGPTIIELTGAPPLRDVDGQSFLPALHDQPLPLRPLYAETGFTHASPAAFDPEHLAVAPRTFDIYRVLPDGVVEMKDEDGDLAVKEKDVGAFDGVTWIVRAPLKDGTVRESCQGNCPNPALRQWLDDTLREGAAPVAATPPSSSARGG